MTKRTFKTKSGDEWEWEETDETLKALKALEALDRLHDDIRRMKAQDDEMNYDTSGK